MSVSATGSLLRFALYSNPKFTSSRRSPVVPAARPKAPMRRSTTAMASDSTIPKRLEPSASAFAVESELLGHASPRSSTLEATLNSLSKWMVAAIYGVVIVWRHDVEVMWVAMGSVLNAYLSLILKRILNHQRPDPNLKSGPGMPSSHAQSLFYASVILVLFMFRWLQVNIATLIFGAFVLASSTYLSWLRVSQQYHTINQILVGAIVGSSIAAAWFWSWHAFVFSLFLNSIWVRIIVVVGSVFSCLGFVFYVLRHWLKDD